jgi:hypothetical protein
LQRHQLQQQDFQLQLEVEVHLVVLVDQVLMDQIQFFQVLHQPVVVAEQAIMVQLQMVDQVVQVVVQQVELQVQQRMLELVTHLPLVHLKVIQEELTQLNPQE